MAAFASGLSEHPTPAVAVGEVVGQVLERLDGPPDLALLFVTPPHAGALQDAAYTVRKALRPGTLLGCAAVSVVGGGREVEFEPAVALWAGRTGPVTPFHLSMVDTPDGPSFTGWPDKLPDDASALLLIPDPFSFPVDALLERLATDRPGLPVVGGMASAANHPGGNRLVLGDEVITSGAVGAFLGPGVSVTTVVSQGCRPVGNPFVVTRAERNVIYELAGKPALERLQEVAGTLSDDDRELLARFVHMGRVIDEHKVDFDRGDFLTRNVLGADPRVGALVVNDLVDVGSTAQFQVRDADSADDDLRQLMTDRSAEAALLFTCNGRGRQLFGRPDHDAGTVSESLSGAPLAGMFCAGELGPVGGRNFVHGFTASVVLLSSAGVRTPPQEAT
jgi:small ligand-binding sensory domain FIST